MNKWTLGLAAVGLVTIPVTMQAEEKMSQLQTALSSTTISGYVNTSAQWSTGTQTPVGMNNHVGGGGSPGYAFNGASKQDGFNLNVVNLVIEKPLDATDQWSAGYKVDMLYGPDAVNWNTSDNANFNAYEADSSSDFALKQAYVALRAPIGNGIDFKMGSFDTIIGYETFNAGSNPNMSRSYGYTFEPTQHTGLLASYQFCKEFGIAGGVANTWNAGINNRSHLYNYGDRDYHTTGKSETSKTYMGAITLTAPDSMGFLAGSTLYGGIVNGFNNNVNNDNDGDNDFASVMSLYGGLTLNTPVKGLKLGLAYDYVSTGNDGGADSVDGMWFNAGALYISYQATEKLSLHGRGEYAWSNVEFATRDNYNGYGGDKVFALTGTVQYDLWANVITRLEVRWDHAADGGKPFNIEDRNALMVAFNAIYKF